MPLAQTVIDNALISIGVIRIGQTPATAERTEGLSTLNRLIDQWNTDRLLVPTIAQSSYQLNPSQQAYSIGPSGADLTAARPLAVESGMARQSNSDGVYSETLSIISAMEWRDIPDKTAKSAFPQKLYYEPTSPNGKFYLWPTPNSTTTYLDLDIWVPLSTFPDLASTNVALYPGYERPLTLALAVELQPRIVGAMLPEQTAREFQEAMQMLKGYNASWPSAPKPQGAAQ